MPNTSEDNVCRHIPSQGHNLTRAVNLNSSSITTSSTSLSSDQSISSTSTLTPARPHFALEVSYLSGISTSSSLSSSSIPTSSSNSSSQSSTSVAATTSTSNGTYITTSSPNTSNYTIYITANTTAPAPTKCTGCVLEALWPLTISYGMMDHSTAWTSIVVTKILLVMTTTYMQGTAIETVVTTQETLNQTKTVVGTANQTVTHTTPVFTFEPRYGTTLTFSTDIEIGITGVVTAFPEQSICNVQVSSITWAYIAPTRTEDWSSFIQTCPSGAPEGDPGTPQLLPTALVNFLKQDPDIHNIFSGSDIATCPTHMETAVDGFPTFTFSPSTAEMSVTGPGHTETGPALIFITIGPVSITATATSVWLNGSSLSLGPSGMIAVLNGITQTFGNAPVITSVPVLTVGGKTISAMVVGGSTAFVLGPGKSSTGGGVLTVDGTTFHMPSDGSGSTVVINGVTSTLDSPVLPVITLNNQIVTASVTGGITAFVLGPGQTLVPGGIITMSGTTYSMPASASGSVVVINGGTTCSLDSKGTALIINGITSSIPRVPASNSATSTHSGSASGRTTSSSWTSTTSERGLGNFIASGLGINQTGGAVQGASGGLEKWVEGLAIGTVGWLIMIL
ncbi:hypothetical protein K504DRAFT_452896 [Pleomassaria siparia CBS 279.74]|uniref:Uncharacterized protein n=1 Tax=Pleomassaria siparia CBS 279.74 TaxID=1314801 RepID=A0A6G1KIS7_9PLEO|nr:hypothetical protein K504DRAFT_452896 [Pleomassaria siparia CBS 279.74]